MSPFHFSYVTFSHHFFLFNFDLCVTSSSNFPVFKSSFNFWQFFWVTSSYFNSSTYDTFEIFFNLLDIYLFSFKPLKHFNFSIQPFLLNILQFCHEHRTYIFKSLILLLIQTSKKIPYPYELARCWLMGEGDKKS